MQSQIEDRLNLSEGKSEIGGDFEYTDYFAFPLLWLFVAILAKCYNLAYRPPGFNLPSGSPVSNR